MAWKVQRLNPDRSRRRLQIIAACANAKAVREHELPHRLRAERLRRVIADRRRVTG